MGLYFNGMILSKVGSNDYIENYWSIIPIITINSWDLILCLWIFPASTRPLSSALGSSQWHRCAQLLGAVEREATEVAAAVTGETVEAVTVPGRRGCNGCDTNVGYPLVN